MTKDEAMKLALEALEAAVSDDQPYIVRCKEAITALRQALEQQPAAPAQADPDEQVIRERDEAEGIADALAEKIAAITGCEIGEHTSANSPWESALDAADDWIASHQPAAQWVGLTDDEVTVLMMQAWGCASIAPRNAPHFSRAIEAKLKEKNT